MTAPILIPLSTEATVTTATVVGVTANSTIGAKLLRVYNSTAGDLLVTIKNAATTTLGTFTIKAGAVEYVSKMPTDTIGISGAGCKVFAIAA
jgi:hypothetical protein